MIFSVARRPARALSKSGRAIISTSRRTLNCSAGRGCRVWEEEEGVRERPSTVLIKIWRHAARFLSAVCLRADRQPANKRYKIKLIWLPQKRQTLFLSSIYIKLECPRRNMKCMTHFAPFAHLQTPDLLHKQSTHRVRLLNFFTKTHFQAQTSRWHTVNIMKREKERIPPLLSIFLVKFQPLR
jgi:hypothetical protein